MLTSPSNPLPRPGITRPLRATLVAELCSFPRDQVRVAVKALLVQALGHRAPYGVVTAWLGLVLAVLYADRGFVKRGLAELGRRGGVSRQTMTAYRKRVMPPEGEPSRHGLLVRPFRGRAGHGVSRWEVGDDLLTAALAVLRADRARSRRSALRQDASLVGGGAPPSPGGPAAAGPAEDSSDGPAGRSAGTTSDWEALRAQLAARRRSRR